MAATKVTFTDKNESTNPEGYFEPQNANELKKAINDNADLLDELEENKVNKVTGERLVSADEIEKLSNTSGINTGDQNLSGYQVTSEKNQNNGYAGLDSSGKVASAQLPSYVDDVIEVTNFTALPGTGETSKIYITLDTNKEYRWSGSAYVDLTQSLSFSNQSEAEAGTENTKVMTALRVAQSIAYQIINLAFSGLNTTSKTIQGAINELFTFTNFNTPVTVAYNTVIPFDKGFTVMTGKTLTTNDTFTIGANPVNESCCKLVLVANGTATPVFTNFDEKTGDWDATNGVKNVLVFYRSESVNYVVISQTVAV